MKKIIKEDAIVENFDGSEAVSLADVWNYIANIYVGGEVYGDLDRFMERYMIKERDLKDIVSKDLRFWKNEASFIIVFRHYNREYTCVFEMLREFR